MDSNVRPARSVLVVGWRNKLLEEGQRLGLDVTAVYGPIEQRWAAPDISLVRNAILVDDPGDVESALSGLARRGLEPTSFDAVCAASEDYITESAVLAQLLGATGLSVRTAIACRDKSVQKARIRAAGVRVADATVLPDVADLAHGGALPESARFPAVLKPVGGVGVTHTAIVENAGQLVDAARRQADSGIRTALLEEYIDGDEWVLDGVISNGQVVFLSVGRYGDPLICVQDGKIVRSIVRDPDIDAADYAAAQPFAQSAVTALGIVDGVIHLETFRDAATREFVFGECAVRPGGSWICELVEAKFGVDLHAAHLRAACGILGTPDPKVRPGYFGMAQIPMVAGILESCPSEDDVLQLPDVILADIRIPAGHKMRSGTTTVNARIGGIVVSGSSPAEVEATIQDSVQWFLDRVVVR